MSGGPVVGPTGAWELAAPLGRATLDPSVSPEDAARVLALLRSLAPAGGAADGAEDGELDGGTDGAGDRAEDREVGGPGAADPAPTGVWVDPDDLVPPAGDAGEGPAATAPSPDGPGAPEPEELSPAPTAPSADPAQDEAPGGALDGAPEQGPAPAVPVVGLTCPASHLNPPSATTCAWCHQPLDPRPVVGARPAVATLTVSTGEQVPVTGPVVVGRAPRPQGTGPQDAATRLVTVPSPTHLVSRSHLHLTVTGWSVLVRDLGSSNGTVLLRPGQPPVLIASALPTPLAAGDVLDIGDGATLRLDPPA